MWDDAHIGTEVPADIPGRGTISTPVGPREAQVYKLPELDLTVPDEQLSEADAELRRQLLDECRAALALRPDRPVLDDGRGTIEMLAVDDAGAWMVQTPHIPMKANGSGDVTAALFTAHYRSSGDAASALAKTVSSVYDLLQLTYDSGQRELQLVEAQEFYAHPREQFAVTRVR